MTLCEITPTREIVHVCFVAESFYTIYTFYTAEINPCFTMADYICPQFGLAVRRRKG